MLRASALVLVLLLPALQSQQDRPGPPPASMGLHPFYEKHLSAGGLPIVSSAKVPDAALVTARRIIDQMLRNREDIREALVNANIRVAIMAKSELTTDIPEHSDLTPKEHWDKRARGLGATHARPAVSCGEENLLGYKDDPYCGESILIHEFAHTVHEIALAAIDETFDQQLKALYESAMKEERWAKTYAAENHREYWAEGVQAWFDANLTAEPPNGIHNHVGRRAVLKQYDPELAALVAQVFGEIEWRWDAPGAHREARTKARKAGR